MSTSKQLCRLCKSPFRGRSDKVFCTIACKNEYHLRLRRATSIVVRETNKILHRNRSILLEVVGKNKAQRKVDRLILERKKFNFNYFTGQYLNSKGKVYHLIYDFAWMEFTSGEVLIIKRNNTKQKHTT